MQNQQLILITIGFVTLFAWIIFQQISIARLKKKQKTLFSGKNAIDLEKIIIGSQKRLSSLEEESEKLFELVGKVHNLAHQGIHKAEMLRFNPFRDIGGDQSFCVALLNGENDGVVISSLYSKAGTRIYAKKIKNKKSLKHPLTKEEEIAIENACNI